METQTEEMDRISELPESIIHHILSSLSYTPAKLVPMSILSKRWFHLISSFPILDLNFKWYSFRGSHERFYKYIEYTTSKFCQQNVTAHKLELDLSIQKPAELDIVDKCLQVVLNNGVRELVIGITMYSNEQKYRLPHELLSVSVLECLQIRDCELPSSLMCDAVKFKSLIRLNLNDVWIDDEVIKHLTTSCPLLEEFDIKDCHGFERFCVIGHQSLKRVMITYNFMVKRIEIEAPNLSYLYLETTNYTGTPQMNLASCEKLTTVYYAGHQVSRSNDFTDFLTNFPFIENFTLETYVRYKNLKLSSHSLRTLVLHSSYGWKDIKLNTPNLVLFVHSFTESLWHSLLVTYLNRPLLRDSNSLKTCMQCYSEESIDNLWFKELRLFLDTRNGFKVLNLYIHATYSQGFIKLKKLKVLKLPPYELDHVELLLNPDEKSSAHVAFVDVVLWCCRPRSLTFRSSLPLTDFDDVVKFTYEKLLKQEDQGNTTIQIVMSPSSSDAHKNMRDMKLMSMALSPEVNAISFIKEQAVHEADST